MANNPPAFNPTKPAATFATVAMTCGFSCANSENFVAKFDTFSATSPTLGKSILPKTVPRLVMLFLAFAILASAESVAVLKAVSAAPVASYICLVFSVKLSACIPANAKTAFLASTDENRLAKADSSSFTLPFSFSNAPCNPSLSSISLPLAYPNFSSDFCIAVDGDRNACMVAFNCVATSDVLPVMPVRVVIAPNKSSCFAPSVEARGITCPIEEASSGKLV